MSPATSGSPLDGLSTLLDTASALVRDFASDPVRRRYLQIYDRIPPEDRAVIVGVLERETRLRAATLGEGQRLTGMSGRPNPNAQLYVRVLEKVPEQKTVVDHDQMVFANVRAAHLMRQVLAPELHEAWRAAVVEGYATLEPEVRRDVARVLRILLEVLDAAPET